MKNHYYKQVLIFFIVLISFFCVFFLFPEHSLGNKGGHKGKDTGDVSSVITIKVKENQSIRDISEEYLHDPDLWEDLLRANGLKFPHEVRVGMTLSIPVGAISEANKLLEESNILIQKATHRGAKLFAPKKIANAIRLRNTALEKRRTGEWDASANFAKSAVNNAEEALKISIKNQNVPAEAVVTYCYGQVHSRKPSDNVWKDVSQYETLEEGERIRTLSQSYAHILFRDDSRLYLKENSQALIRKMRANLLENTEEAKVSLIEGDVLALLAGGKKNSEFQLDVPGVDTRIKSRQFQVGRDNESTQFANYDKGELEVSSSGEEVVLVENEGVVVPHEQKPSEPRPLLPAPVLVSPDDNVTLFPKLGENIILTWEEVPGAEYYLLEIDQEEIFANIIQSEAIRDTKGIFPSDSESGLFFWRVIAYSADKLPGCLGEPKRIRIVRDNEPPFLVIQSPDQDIVVTKPMIEISGNVEEGVRLTIQDQVVTIGEGGLYRFKQELSPGKNTIIVKATDVAGNVSELKRIINFFPKRSILLSFAPSLYQIEYNHFVVGQSHFALAGKTEPGSSVTVTSENNQNQFTATDLADDSGKFLINTELSTQKDSFIIEVVSRSKKMIKEHIIVELDDKPPIITFTNEIPSAIRQNNISVTGSLEGGNYMELNGEAISLEDGGKFSKEIELKPGKNHLRFIARDPVGNTAQIDREIFLDSYPPEIINCTISPRKVRGGEDVKVILRAKDESGIVKVVPFTIEIGKYTSKGHLLRTDSDGEYSASFHVPKGIKGEVKLKKVILADYLGNSKGYEVRNKK